MSSLTLSFLNVVLVILKPLHFLLNLRISLSISAKKKKENFYKNCIETVGQFGKYCHLNNIIFQSICLEHISTYSGLFKKTFTYLLFVRERERKKEGTKRKNGRQRKKQRAH